MSAEVSGGGCASAWRACPPACDSPLHECQQIRSQKGAKSPYPAIGWYLPRLSATAMQISRCCTPSSPPSQMATTRGRTSLRTYTSSAARLTEGGGGGARTGS